MPTEWDKPKSQHERGEKKRGSQKISAAAPSMSMTSGMRAQMRLNRLAISA
jgi:hypothetical protein